MTDFELVYCTVLESYPQNTDKKGGSTSLHTQKGHINMIDSNTDIPKTLSPPPPLPPRRTALENPKEQRRKTWRLPLTKKEKVFTIINIILATLVVVLCVLFITTENSAKHKTQEAKTINGSRNFNRPDKVNFEGTYLIENLMTSRYLLSTGERLASNGINGKINLSKCVGSDDDYCYRAHWVIRNQGRNSYIIKNLETRRCLWSTGDKFTGNRGDEGGWSKSPTCVGAANCNLARSHWKIINKGGGKYLIKNIGTKRYLLSTGDNITGNRGDEGGYSRAPSCVGSDKNYENRAYWKLLKD